MEANPGDALLPLIIGVTGHRKVSTTDPQLRECIRRELLRLRAAYPDSPFLILSGLAEGADRLVVRIAIEYLAAKVIAVLPFAEEEFRKDFPAPESQSEFSDLLKQAQAVVVVPQREPPESIRERGEARNRQYARVGGYVVEQAQILIALWDGKPARGTGGTGDVVKWRMSDEVPAAFSSLVEERNVLWAGDAGRLIHIHPQTCEVKHLSGTAEMRGETEAALRAVNGFNRDVTADNQETRGTALVRARHGLFADEEQAQPVIREESGFLKLASVFAAADALASRYQKRDLRLVAVIAFTFFLAMTFAYPPLMPIIPVAVAAALYLVFMLAMSALLWLGRRGRIEDRFLDYRALAEGLRVAAFWRLAGVHHRASLNYLSEHMGVLSWVREALRSAEMAALPESDCAGDLSERIALVKKLWLENQADYFKRRLEQLRKRAKTWKRIGATFFVLSCVAMAWKLIAFLTGQPKSLPYATALTGLTVAAGLAIAYFTRKKTYDALVKRYTLSAALYERALNRLNAEQYPPEKVLFQIGKEALNENADWLWLQRETPLKPRR